MLASAGRRYLFSLINSSHHAAAVAAQQCHQSGICQQLPLLQQATTQIISRSVATSTAPSSSSSDAGEQKQQQGTERHDATQPPPPQQQPPAQHTEQPAASKQQQQQQPVAGAAAAAAMMGPRKVNPAAFGGSKGPTAKREGIVHVNSTMNNTHLVLTDRDNKVETWVSGGTVGYKNANKASPMAAELAGKELARRALDKGFHAVVVKLKGMGKNKQFAVQSLAASGLTVTQLWDVTPIPYNGCRLPRRRRV